MRWLTDDVPVAGGKLFGAGLMLLGSGLELFGEAGRAVGNALGFVGFGFLVVTIVLRWRES